MVLVLVLVLELILVLVLVLVKEMVLLGQRRCWYHENESSFSSAVVSEADREELELWEIKVKVRVRVLEITIRQDNNTLSIVINNNNTSHLLLFRSINCIIEKHLYFQQQHNPVALFRHTNEEGDETSTGSSLYLINGGRSECATSPQHS